MKLKIQLSILLFAFFYSIGLDAYNLRQISSRDGLSNSSVFCLYQDNNRFLWIGTFDGLNMYDGRNIHIYKPDINNRYSLSSNVIRDIIETKDYLWISTKWGLNKLSQKKNIIVEYHNEFKEDSHLCKDKNENLYVLGKSGILSLYDETRLSFIDLPVNKKIECKNVRGLYIDANGMLWINHNGVLERYTVLSQNKENTKIIRHADYSHQYPITFTSFDQGKLLFVDNIGNLYSIAPQGTVFICNIQSLLRENGEISSIIYDSNDILIGFKTNGIVRLKASNNYNEERIDINCGVFSLLKDNEQDVIWIGTDGQGIYAYTNNNYTFNNITLSQLPLKKQRPVRAIYADQQNNLWLGTKDNGVIRIKNYTDKKEYASENIIHYTNNDKLVNNEVFAFEKSAAYNVLWIGSNGPGINYYSYNDEKMHSLANNISNDINNVHSMFESKDSALWIGSGNTLIKIKIDNTKRQLKIKNKKRYSFNLKNNQPYNNIYALHQENDSIIWVGIRGNGIIRFNTKTEKYKLLSFDEHGIAPMNDILCIHQDNNLALWLGTSYGLTRLTISPSGKYECKNYNENNGLPNNTIHGILSESNGKLWLSSNTGIILFDPLRESFCNFNQKNGLKNIEFSDNAYFKDEKTSICFFGGVDGIVSIEKGQAEVKQFVPEIHFTKIRFFNETHMLSDFVKEENGELYIELKSKQNNFAISFVAPDYINGENSYYFYRLKDFNNKWIESKSNEAQFTNITHGAYTLEVRYNNGTGVDDQTSSIRIVILPPWFLTIYAKIAYTLLISVILYGIFLYIKWKYEQRRKKISFQLEQKYKEEIYESKLRFFTNITHELSTPLTLIHGPCERILSYNDIDDSVRKYTEIIKYNTERLNALIQEIIDFRRIETGNNVYRIESVDVSKLTLDIISSFSELAEQNSLLFEKNITSDIIWNTDSASYSKIVYNLISNAFKYTPPKGYIRVSMHEKDSKLILSVYNTGKGIPKEKIPFVFNRYTILDNIEENSIKGLSSRNGLGLAICDNLVKHLQGNINIESELNQYVEFMVTLPHLDIITPVDEKSKYVIEHVQETKFKAAKNLLFTDAAEKDRILIIDDNKDLLWLLKDIFSDEYIVDIAENGKEGFECLKKETPDLIITDIMMPEIDGISFTMHLKDNKHTMHIPLIILSAKNTNEEKIEGIDSGADIYISKPFDVEYLRAIVRHQIKNRKKIAQYYNSSASAFEYTKGQLIEKEDKEFLQSIVDVINDNLHKADFSTDDLAVCMQMSTRNLYRKLKELEYPTPNDLLKEYRIKYAARLIVTTNFTIQEVMYNSGFNNRSHFYKEFSKAYGKTPTKYRESYKLKAQLYTLMY